MARNPDTTVSLTYVDRSGEGSRVQFAPSQALADDITKVTLPANSVALIFVTALQAVSDGLIVRRSLTTSVKLTNAAAATDGQREERWLVVYQDNTTMTLYSFEIPCRKASIKPPQGQDQVDLNTAPWPAFKTAVEAAVVSPDGNPITVLAVRLIGRNL